MLPFVKYNIYMKFIVITKNLIIYKLYIVYNTFIRVSIITIIFISLQVDIG